MADHYTSGQRSIRTPKLKDTCDACYASKVRCDKQKPICGRCSRLAFSCYYSPARRIGRPCPLRKSKIKPAAPSKDRTQPDVLLEDGRSESKAQLPVSLEDTQRVAEQMNDSGLIDDFDPAFGDFLSCHAPTRSSENTSKRSSPCEQNESAQESAPMEWVDFADTLGGDAQDLHMDSGSTAVAACFQSSFPPHPREKSSKDCVTVALDILETLNSAMLQRMAQVDFSGGEELPQVDHLFDTVSLSVKQVSTILVCPCSEKPDAALLAAAICAAISDIFSDRVQQVRAYSTNPSLVHDAEDTLDEYLFPTTHSQPNLTISRELEELTKVAHLTVLFARRFRAPTVDSALAALLTGLVNSLTVKLRYMTEEATSTLIRL